jgi:type III secretion protein N (ATPase)
VIDRGRLREVLAAAAPLRWLGRVTEASPVHVRATAAGARPGEVVEIEVGPGAPVRAEAAAVRGRHAWLVPLGDPAGIAPGAPVRPTGRTLAVRAGAALLGRVLDGLGRPIDGRPLPRGLAAWEVDRAPPGPLERLRLSRPFPSGVRSVDAFCTLAEGQRVGLLAGPGAGKSSLMGILARQGAADVCVVGLVGERGREIREVVDDVLGPEGMARSVVVAAASDAPAIVRVRAAQVATALAEWFSRVEGRRVLLLLDSLTRYARAVREVGLALGEPPVRQGFPARVFAELPRLLERAGAGPGGPITAVYTVLAAGDDAEDPLTAELRGLLDGHVVLDRRLAEAGRFPAVDVLSSLSRAMPAVASPEHLAAAGVVRRWLGAWEAQRELVAAGAWRPGSDAVLDEAVARLPAIEAFLRQGPLERSTLADAVEGLNRIAAGTAA